jgi:hypothetical protein
MFIVPFSARALHSGLAKLPQNGLACHFINAIDPIRASVADFSQKALLIDIS